MYNRLIPAAAVALTLGLGTAVFAQESETPDLSTVVASVNGVDITLGHIAVAKSTLPEQYRNLPATVLFPGILDQLIQQTALMQSFEGERPARIVLALENESRSLVAGEVVESIMAGAVTEELLQEVYAQAYSGDSNEEEYKASHILVETQEAALQIQSDLNNGADFAETARAKSTGPSGPRGGDLGWFGTGQMVPSFEEAVIALEPNQISDPVQTQFGWHVIKLMEKRLKTAPPLEDVRAELEQKIRTDAVTAHIEKLTAAANIDRSGAEGIAPEVLDQIDLTKLP